MIILPSNSSIQSDFAVNIEPTPIQDLPVSDRIPAPVLPYAETSARYGVNIIQEPGRTRVILPPIRFRTAVLLCLPIALFVGIRVGAALSEGVLLWRSGLLLLGAIIAPFFAIFYKRVFEVNATSVMAGLLRGTHLSISECWPIEVIGDIRYSTIAGKLIIRVTGKDLVEYRLVGDRQTREEIALVLQKALVANRSRS